ncbi:MAG: bifunctional homocysteine S-methyltransferase/methylenetetrahydrofolate reductase [Acidobacteria bacterium]|nr:bifunctional homocysteine S-methyltransferase/methylenetetrahydrofolate reductase [Acidobacteriota bacterium]
MSSATQSKTRAQEFREALAQGVLVADGAMGTMLYEKGVFINRCYDELNLSAPHLVKEVHEAYVKAGAQIIEANTFGANRGRLATFSLGEKLAAINQAGVRLAREAAGDAAFVAGSVGPTGLRNASPQELREIFTEQAAVLVGAGVDLLVLETFFSIEELREAVTAVRAAAGPVLAIVAQVTINDDGAMLDGTSTEDFTALLDQWPVDVIGLNCSVGPKATLETVERIMRQTAKPVSAMPNAGHPADVEGRKIYLCSPEYMSQYARRFLWAGVKIVGGCCGTTPEHIKLVRSEARSLQPGHRTLPVATVDETKPPVQKMPLVPVGAKSKLGAKLAAKQFVTFVEILPPRGVDPSREVAGAILCREAGIDVINVPDGPRASARLSAAITCKIFQEQAGIESVLHFCCRDRNILGMQSDLLGAHALGVRNLICITGDPPRMGAHQHATAVFDVDAIGLADIVTNLNSGLDIGGNAMGSQTALLLGVGANPGALNIDEEVRRFERKVAAGAEYVVTQPVFDIKLLENFLKRTEHCRIPVVCGIWPLTSYRNAQFMVDELRVPVPEPFMERMRQAADAEAARREGVAIAQEMTREVQWMVEGIQLSAPFGRYQMAVDVAAVIEKR